MMRRKRNRGRQAERGWGFVVCRVLKLTNEFEQHHRKRSPTQENEHCCIKAKFSCYQANILLFSCYARSLLYSVKIDSFASKSLTASFIHHAASLIASQRESSTNLRNQKKSEYIYQDFSIAPRVTLCSCALSSPLSNEVRSETADVL